MTVPEVVLISACGLSKGCCDGLSVWFVLGRWSGPLEDSHGKHEISSLGQTAPYTGWSSVTRHAVVDRMVYSGLGFTGDMAADQVPIQQ